MKLKDFDFRIWLNGSYIYLDEIGFEKISQNYFLACCGDGEELTEKYKFYINANIPKETYEKRTQLEDSELELYTGFEDKKGVKIFENDIVLFIPNDSEKFLHTINYDKERGFFFSDDCNLNDEYCEGCTEVIGNIHENKELVDFMEKEKEAFKKFHQKFENKYDKNGKPVKEFYEEDTRLSIYFKQELEKLLDSELYK
ncbi:YopX family protein [Campylobacter upsaliensis]|uniref:YopX family protein n=1 Tax=Campylobacter upsaliensis TaxID=28080 RepID=UPI00214A451F|nr:YopX family protein [Campylobacter upsaliensis]MCR2091501.1 YopX family protein [Campylobacter upsaliensis]